MSDTAALDVIPDEVADPISGEIVNTHDTDSLIDALERIKEDLARINHFKATIVRAIAKFATGATKTQRVRGVRRTVKVETPDLYFDQSILKEAFHSYPSFSSEFIRIDRLAVKLREYAKLKSTTETNEARALFQKMLIGAERPSTALPTITIEE